MTTLQALELALLGVLVELVVMWTAIASYLLFLTTLVIGMCLANQVQIFLVEQSILGLTLLSSTLLSLATALAALFVVFFIFVDNETFADLAALLGERLREVVCVCAPLFRLPRHRLLLPRWNHQCLPFAFLDAVVPRHPQTLHLLHCRAQRRDQTSWLSSWWVCIRCFVASCLVGDSGAWVLSVVNSWLQQLLAEVGGKE
jgi:hypothetical protein